MRLGGQIDLLLRYCGVGVVGVDFAIDLQSDRLQVRLRRALGLLGLIQECAVVAAGEKRLQQALAESEVPDQGKPQVFKIGETGEVETGLEIRTRRHNVALRRS